MNLSHRRSTRPYSVPCVLFSALIFLFSFSACGETEVPESSEASVSSHAAGRHSSAAASSGSPAPEKTGESSFLDDKTKSVSVEVEPVLAQTGDPTFLYAEPSPEGSLAAIEGGQEFSVTETGDPLWYFASLADGTTGYLYGDNLYRVSEDGVSSQSLFLEMAENRFAALKEQFPEGKYWNHMYEDLPYGEETPFSVSDTPCDHDVYGELYCNFYNGKTEELFPYDTLCQCLGFASFLSDQIFGTEAPIHTFHDPYALRIGDHIRLHEYEHSMTVVEITDEYLTVAEVNADYQDCLIEWSRQFTYYELEELSWDSEYITRYPFYPEDGSLVPWDGDDGSDDYE